MAWVLTWNPAAMAVLLLIEDGRLLAAVANVLGSVVVCVVGCWLGMAGARALV